MAQEIERKFLVKDLSYKQLALPVLYKQGYLCTHPERVVRIRIVGEKGYCTIKGENRGIARTEFEYEIPFSDAQELLTLCEQPIIEKNRYFIHFRQFIWEIDEFLGDNEGLVLAEIELPDEETMFEKPSWIGNEVSDDPRYYNSNLMTYPYKNWK